MTKFKFTSLILILSLLVVACGDSNEASSDIATDDEKSVTQTTVESTNEVSEPAVETLTGEILIDGSSTVFPITQAVAEEFTILNPNVKISVGVSGTSSTIVSNLSLTSSPVFNFLLPEAISPLIANQGSFLKILW